MARAKLVSTLKENFRLYLFLIYVIMRHNSEYAAFKIKLIENNMTVNLFSLSKLFVSSLVLGVAFSSTALAQVISPATPRDVKTEVQHSAPEDISDAGEKVAPANDLDHYALDARVSYTLEKDPSTKVPSEELPDESDGKETGDAVAPANDLDHYALDARVSYTLEKAPDDSASKKSDYSAPPPQN